MSSLLSTRSLLSIRSVSSSSDAVLEVVDDVAFKDKAEAEREVINLPGDDTSRW